MIYLELNIGDQIYYQFHIDFDNDGDRDIGIVKSGNIEIYENKPESIVDNFNVQSVIPPNFGQLTGNEIYVQFTEEIDRTSIQNNEITIYGSQKGYIEGEFLDVNESGAEYYVIFVADQDFFPGEKVTMVLTDSIRSTNNASLIPTTLHWHKKPQEVDSLNFAPGEPISFDDNFNLAAADIDKDGDIDIAFTGKNDNQVSIAWNNGTAEFEVQTLTSNNILGASGIEVADIDADGRLDLITASERDNTIRLFRQTSEQRTFDEIIIDDSRIEVIDINVFDFDQDGDLDILNTSFYDQYLYWHENKGNLNFKRQPLFYDTIESFDFRDIKAGDLDGDLDIDLVLGNHDGLIILNNGGENMYLDQGGDIIESVDLVDIDRDGDLDILASTESTYQILYLNWGENQFQFAELSDWAQVELESRSIMSANIDGDHDMDIIYSNSYTLNANNPDSEVPNDWGYESDPISHPNPGNGTSIAPADYDNDGDLDLAFANSNGLYWIENISEHSAGEPRPNKVLGVTASINELSQVELSWIPNTEADIDFYKIYRGTSPDNLISIATTTHIETTTNTWFDGETDLENFIYYAVSAVNTSGREGSKSDVINIQDLTPVTIIPDPITGLNVIPIGLSKAQLSWDFLPISDVSYYKIYRGLNSSTLDSLGKASSGFNKFDDDNIQLNTDYFYAVSAVSPSNDEGELSDVVSLSINPTPLSVKSINSVTEELVGTNSAIEFVFNTTEFEFFDIEGAYPISLLDITNNTTTNMESWVKTDSSLIIYPDSVFSGHTIQFRLNSEVFLSNSSGNFYIDSNNNQLYDAEIDDYLSPEFEVAQLADFDLSGSVDFDDFVLISSVWNTDDYKYDIAPYLSLETDDFPGWAAVGDSKYNIQDLYVFIQYWNYSIQNPKYIQRLLTKSLSNDEFKNDGSIEINRLDINNEFDINGGETQLIYSIINRNSSPIHAINLEIEYDPEVLNFKELNDSKVFNTEKNSNSVLISSVDSVSGTIVINVANFGKISSSNDREIVNISFQVKKASNTDITILSDLRSTNNLRIVTKSSTYLKEEDLHPEEFKLFQNYPNPFNPSTTIQFSLSENNLTNLSIYTITGQKIAELINEKMNAGYYSIKWDASGFASGMYIYRLVSGQKVTTKKMLLIK